MSEKILIVPGDVRGLGNIVIPHSIGDYVGEASSITSSTETVDNLSRTVYSLGYLPGSYMTLYQSPTYVTYTDSLTNFTVGVRLRKKANNSNITGAEVSCIVNDTTTLTGTTNSSGVVTFTVPFVTGQSYYSILFKYTGDNTVCGCILGHHVFVGNIIGMTLHGTSSLITTDVSSHLIGTLTAYDVNRNIVGVPNRPVSFYEEYTPTYLNVTANPSIITGATEDTITESTVTAVLKDSDNSFIQGETVDLYVDVPWLFRLGNPQSVTPSSTSTTSTLIKEDYNLTLPAKFELTFDLKSSIQGARFIMCKHDDTATNRQYGVTIATDSNKFYYGTRTTSTSETATSVSNDGNYHQFKITRNGDTLTYYIDGTSVGTKTASWLDSYTYTFYFVTWATGTMSIRNLTLTEIE